MTWVWLAQDMQGSPSPPASPPAPKPSNPCSLFPPVGSVCSSPFRWTAASMRRRTAGTHARQLPTASHVTTMSHAARCLTRVRMSTVARSTCLASGSFRSPTSAHPPHSYKCHPAPTPRSSSTRPTRPILTRPDPIRLCSTPTPPSPHYTTPCLTSPYPRQVQRHTTLVQRGLR